jgi:hypothetical protein
MSGDDFQHILDTLPPQSPRSRLAPYGGLIDKLRRRGRTYREIVDILATQCGLRVSVSTLHENQSSGSFLATGRRIRLLVTPSKKPVERHTGAPGFASLLRHTV